MTKAVRTRVLKDANGDISDHLHNHIHLTNCIHLKNHIHKHKHSPMMADSSLMRDLVVLRRSRSLRDPSMSPPSLQSPNAIDLLNRRSEKVAIVETGRRSVGTDRPNDGKRLTSNSSPLDNLATSKVVPADGSSNGGKNKNIKDKVRSSKKEDPLTTLSEKLREVPADSDGMASSHIHFQGRHSQHEKAEASVSLNRTKRRKFRSGRKISHDTIASRDGRPQIEMSVASNSLAQGAGRPKHRKEERGRDHDERNVTGVPRNGCGIPWNWSRLHDRSKNLLDIAGRSFSCGLSDSKIKKGDSLPNVGDFPNMPMISDCSSSSAKSDAEALPLLIDDSQESNRNAWVHNYSGELGIYADGLSKHISDSDLVSDARPGDQGDELCNRDSRHQSLTQKYMPKTFRDLVGQSLVAQALSNAVTRKRVGFLYVFYGPHGTGKTSCARVFARALNCECLEDQRPCGFCDSCITHDMGKSLNIKEVGPVGNLDFRRIMEVLENMIVSIMRSQYRIFIFDDCDTLSAESWSVISKIIDRAPRRVVFVLISSTLDVLPHIILSRCQKFFFPKLKDADIIYSLQWIATKEDFEIDKDALKLIASRSDGSLRDAEMTLDQLSLLGQRISVPLVQEMVGLISDEKLVDLLDFALSADTVNTVKNLREIMESGVEPLALMSQVATVITDILAGSYYFSKEGQRRKFFWQQPLSKEDMEKLRRALKTLSEAEKHLRTSNDRFTWLTAAFLQLAPDQQYILPTSSADISLHQSSLNVINTNERHRPRKSNVERADVKGEAGVERKGYAVPQQRVCVSSERSRSSRQLPSKIHKEIEAIWLEVLQKIRSNSLKEFLYQEGKLMSFTFGEASIVQLLFSSHLTKSKAEKFKSHILQAFETVLGSPVTIEIRCESRTDVRAGANMPLVLPASQDAPYHNSANSAVSNRETMSGDNLSRRVLRNGQLVHFDSSGMGRSEIVEIEATSREARSNERMTEEMEGDRGFVTSSTAFVPEQRRLGEQSHSQSLVRSKVSLAHVIQRVEGQRSGWSKSKAVSIAEKLEQENLRLEPRSKSLLCWKATRVTRRRLSRLKARTRKPQALLKFVSCGKCLSGRSPK